MTALSEDSRKKRKEKGDITPIKRKKYLNILYFIDSEKSTALKISVTQAKWLVGTIACVCIWAITLSIAFYQTYTTNQLAQIKLTETLHVLFEYEARYDNIFEKSYQQDKKTNNHHTSQAVVSMAKEATMDVSEPEELKTNAHDLFEPTQITENIPNFISTESGISSDIRAIIESPKMEYTDDQLVLKFGIRNSKSPKKLEGKIWAKLSYKDTKHRVLFASYPPNLSVDEEGNALSPMDTGSTFSIRHYKDEEFIFSLKNDTLDTLENLSIYLITRDAQQVNFHIPIAIHIARLSSLNLEKSYAPLDKNF